ncbi:MAG: VRR-NUC domain-containing protein [Colwellia sp.]|nr:VRR-NUC domain-containing protein [Colwellia sp.]
MQDREHQEQCAVIRWCQLHETKYPALGMIFAIPNGGHRHIRVAQKLKVEGVKAGVPDLLLACTNLLTKYKSIRWNGLFIEMKSGKNKVTKLQEDWIMRLLLHGYKVVVCYSWTEAVQAIIDYLGLPERI